VGLAATEVATDPMDAMTDMIGWRLTSRAKLVWRYADDWIPDARRNGAQRAITIGSEWDMMVSNGANQLDFRRSSNAKVAGRLRARYFLNFPYPPSCFTVLPIQLREDVT